RGDRHQRDVDDVLRVRAHDAAVAEHHVRGDQRRKEHGLRGDEHPDRELLVRQAQARRGMGHFPLVGGHGSAAHAFSPPTRITFTLSPSRPQPIMLTMVHATPIQNSGMLYSRPQPATKMPRAINSGMYDPPGMTISVSSPTSALAAAISSFVAPASGSRCGCLRCHSSSRLDTTGSWSKLWAGGGEGMVHSSVRASHGSAGASWGLRIVLKML